MGQFCDLPSNIPQSSTDIIIWCSHKHVETCTHTSTGRTSGWQQRKTYKINVRDAFSKSSRTRVHSKNLGQNVLVRLEIVCHMSYVCQICGQILLDRGLCHKHTHTYSTYNLH